MYYLLVIYLEL